MAENKNNNVQAPEEIKETALTVVSESPMKKILKGLGYVGSALLGVLATLLVVKLSGGDDDDDETPAENTQE